MAEGLSQPHTSGDAQQSEEKQTKASTSLSESRQTGKNKTSGKDTESTFSSPEDGQTEFLDKKKNSKGKKKAVRKKVVKKSKKNE